MSAYVDAARSILAFVERCGNKPAARTAAIKSVAAHRYLDAPTLARVVTRKERTYARLGDLRSGCAAVALSHHRHRLGAAGVVMNF